MLRRGGVRRLSPCPIPAEFCNPLPATPGDPDVARVTPARNLAEPSPLADSLEIRPRGQLRVELPRELPGLSGSSRLACVRLAPLWGLHGVEANG